MSKALFFATGLLAMSAAIVAGQAPAVGAIEGTVMRQGTTEPLADVQISVGGSGAVLGARQAQTVLDAAAAGNPGVSSEQRGVPVTVNPGLRATVAAGVIR